MRSLSFKLTLAFLVVSLTGVVLVALLIGGITSSQFNQFLVDKGLSDFAASATTYYKAHGSWDGVEAAFRAQGLTDGPGQPNGNNPPNPPFVLVDAQGNLIIASGHFHIGDPLPSSSNTNSASITVDNKVVGTVYSTGGPPNRGPNESRFITGTYQALILAALGAMIIAVLLGLFLARTITRPVRELTLASAALASGQLDQQVQVRSQDELGELTRTFNKMSADLQRSNQLRKQMTADIAHDLRTPLSVITGYLEGLKDGVLKPTPKRFSAMYDEAIFLQRLIEDLRTLSLADAGELSLNLQQVQPGDLIERAAAFYQHSAEQKQIHLNATAAGALPAIQADPERMQQALGNLVSNALRYTPETGRIELSAYEEDNGVRIDVRDTGSGIAPEDLPHVFERFYRGDASRNESGSGLGLAITKSIIELQGGKISASSAGPDLGSTFTIWLPLPDPNHRSPIL